MADAAGNSAAEVTATFTSVADADTTPPVIADVADADIPEANIATWEAPDTTAHDNVDGDISGNIGITYTSEDAGSNVTDLASARAHLSAQIGNTVTVAYNVADAAGNSAAEVTATFTSILQDVTRPKIVSLSPADNATGVAIDTNFEMVFDEVVYKNDQRQISLNPEHADPVSISVEDCVSGNGANTIIIDPENSLVSGESYSILVDEWTFMDIQNNRFEGITDPTTWNFTTLPIQVVNVDITSASGIYSIGDTLQIAVTFSEPVVVTDAGIPSLVLETGDTDREALYSSGSGNSTIYFMYTIQEGDAATDLDYTNVNALQLNGGTIVNAAETDVNANIVLPAPGAAGSISHNKDIQINTQRPTSITISQQDVIPTNGHVTLTADKALSDESWGLIFNQIKDNTAGGLNWITGSGEDVFTSGAIAYSIEAGNVSCELINCYNGNPNGIDMMHDFVISDENVIDLLGNTASSDIVIDACSDIEYHYGYPKVGDTGNTLKVSADKLGEIYYVVLPDGANVPTAEQVKAGKNAAGEDANFRGTGVINIKDTELSFDLGVLTAEDFFDLYVAVEDNDDNLMPNVEQFDLTAAPNPVVTDIDFSHDEYTIATDGLTANETYELQLKDDSLMDVTTDANSDMTFGFTQLDQLAAQGEDTLQIRLKADGGQPASGLVTLAAVTVGQMPQGAACDQGDNGYNTNDEKLIGLLVSTDYLVNINGNGWNLESSDVNGEITGLTIPSQDTQVQIKLAGAGSCLPSETFTTAGRLANVVPDALLDEDHLNGITLAVTLVNDTVKQNQAGGYAVHIANITLNNLPGASVTNITNEDEDGFDVTISYDGRDFDTDITNFSVTIAEEELNSGFSLTTCDMTIEAIEDPESITVAWAPDPGTGGAQATMDAEIIRVSLAGGQFVQENIGEIIITGSAVVEAGIDLQEGGTIFQPVGDTAVDIHLSWDGTGYVTDKILRVNVPASAYRDSTGDGVLANDITCPAPIEKASITADPALTELNLDGSTLNISLTGCQFTDNDLNVDNFELINAPLSATLANPVRQSDSEAIVEIDYDGYDFDSDYNNASIQIKAAEITCDHDITSNPLTISADNQEGVESISVDWSGDPGTNGLKTEMDDEALEITITNGNFVTSGFGDIYLSGSAVQEGGISLESVALTGSADQTKIRVCLNWNGTDYQTDKVLDVHIPVAAYIDSSGDAELTASITCYADTPERAAFLVTDDGEALTEDSLDGRWFTSILQSEAFNEITGITDKTNIILNNAPEGIIVGSYGGDSTTLHFSLIDENLMYTPDFDQDIGNFSITIAGEELQSGIDLTSNVIPITAINDNEEIQLFWSDTYGGAENTMDSEWITVTLTGGQFISPAAVNDVYLSGSAVADAHITKDPVNIPNLISKNQLEIYLDWDGTDYDENKTLTVNVPTSAYVDSTGGGTLTADIICTATQDGAILSAENVPLLESNFAGDYTVILEGDEFKDTGLTSYFELNNAPSSATYTVHRDDATTATISVSYDQSRYDFDNDITNFSVTIDGTALESGLERTSNDLTIQAVDDPEALTIEWLDDANHPGTYGAKATMDNEELLVTMTGGNFVPENINHITLTGSAVHEAGITLGGINILGTNDDLYIQLDLPDSTDYIEDETLTVIIPSSAYCDSTGNDQNLTISIVCCPEGSFPPEVVIDSCTPLSHSNNNPVDMSLIITFDKDVQRGSGNIVLKNTNTGEILEAIDVSDTDRVQINGTQATIDPLNDLPQDIRVSVLIDEGAFTNIYEIDFAGISSINTWYFDIIDMGNLVASIVSPEDGSYSRVNYLTIVVDCPDPEHDLINVKVSMYRLEEDVKYYLNAEHNGTFSSLDTVEFIADENNEVYFDSIQYTNGTYVIEAYGYDGENGPVAQSVLYFDNIAPSAIDIDTQDTITAGQSTTLTVTGGPLQDDSWNAILEQIRQNTAQGAVWITGINPEDLTITPDVSGDSAQLTNNSQNNAVIQADFIISKNNVYDKSPNSAVNDITIDAFAE